MNMKRGYYQNQNSREKSYDRQHKRRSSSRSRDKNHKKYTAGNNAREINFRSIPAKVESDVKNHFRFKLPSLTTKEEEDTIIMLKTKLNQCIGPVEHITRSKQTMTLNLGFKYDIDAISFLETGGFTVKTASHKINLEPIPTKAFQNVLKQKRETMQNEKSDRKSKSKSKSKSRQKHSNNRHKKSKSKSRSRSNSKYRSRSNSYSSSSSSNRDRNRNRSRDRDERGKDKDKGKGKDRERDRSKPGRRSYSNERQRQRTGRTIKLQIYGIPAYINEQKILTILNQFHGGHKILKASWRYVNGSNCQYLEIRVDSQKADKLLDHCSKLQVDGRPVVIIEESQRPAKSLLNFQIQIQFPKQVHPIKVLKQLCPYAKVVQIVANQQMQQDGKSKCFILTLNDPSVVNLLKKIGQISNGTRLSEPKSGQNVYRPIQLLPTKQQLL